MSPANRPPRYPAPRRMGCITRLLLTILFLGLAAVAFWIARPYVYELAAQRGWVDTEEKGVDEHPQLDEIYAYGSGSNKVVVVPIKGVIYFENGAGLQGGGTAGFALQCIQQATIDPAVKAIILDIDSPGGSVTASDIIYHALRQFRLSSEDRRVLAICGDLAASGGYYAALSANHIIVRPTSLVGSIGVLAPRVNVYELGQKIGVHDASLRSHENKDAGNPLRPPDPARDASYQRVIDAMHQRFSHLVGENRQIPAERMAEIATGDVFDAEESVQLRLADEIGYWEDAMDRCAELLNVPNVKVYRYEEHFSLRSVLGILGEEAFRLAFSAGNTPRMEYRWQP